MPRTVRTGVALVAGCLAALAAYLLWPRGLSPDQPSAGPAVVWEFESPHRGGFVAAPWVSDDAVYIAAAHDRGLRSSGAVYALDPASGAVRWTFDADGRMLPTASAPVVADGRLYVGEGMHGHFACSLYCLDPATGRQLWAIEATDHIESTPAVSGGVVYFGAGNDGVYAADAATGKELWRFSADLHIDASPWVSNGRVIVGSGPSRKFSALQVVSLDVGTGTPAWRVATDLPAWGSPRAAGGRVFIGLANGRLNEGARPPETPAGAVLCLDERTGDILWRFDAEDAVFQQPTADGGRVYFGSRDGNLYAVDAVSGELVYRVPVGGPVIGPPAVSGGKVYVISVGGRLVCLSAADGRELWDWDVRRGRPVEPVVLAGVRVSGGRVYVAAELKTGAGSAAVLYCLRE
jgi:outer membrane protein assembly factor BamB